MNQNNTRTRVAGLAVIILLALAIVGVIVYYFISNNNKTTTKTTTTAVVATNNTTQNEPQQATATNTNTSRLTGTENATEDFIQYAKNKLANTCTRMFIIGQIGDNVVVNSNFDEEVNGECQAAGGAIEFYHKTNGAWALAFGTQSEVPCTKFAEFNIPRELPNADTCLDLATNKTITNPITSQ